jgi:hypothetical protein
MIAPSPSADGVQRFCFECKRGRGSYHGPDKKTVGLCGAPTVRMQSINRQPEETAPQAHLRHHQLLKLPLCLKFTIAAISKVESPRESRLFSKPSRLQPKTRLTNTMDLS